MRDNIELPGPLKRLIPRQTKQPVKSALLRYIFRQAMKELATLPPGEVRPESCCGKLRLAWDNQGWDAKLGYFEEIARRVVTTRGPILECGSGLSTLALGHLAARQSEVWALEHNPDWHARVSGAIKRHHVPGVRLCHAPLRDYDGFKLVRAAVGEVAAQVQSCDL